MTQHSHTSQSSLPLTSRLSTAEIVEQKLQEGIYTGKPLNGYRRCRGSDVHVVDESKRALIAEIFRLAAIENLSVRKLQQVCIELGLTGSNGKPISLNSLHLMLTHPFYAGFIRYQGTLVRGQHEAVISKTLFDTVQRNLRKRRC